MAKEEMQAKKEARQASPEYNSAQVSREDWLKSIEDAEEKKARSQSQSPKRMHKVPQMLRNTKDFERFYEPSVVSIGPYHNGRSEFEPVEKLKPIIVKQFIMGKNLLELFNEFEKKIKELNVKMLYDEDVAKQLDEETFTRMMFVDGCFVLHFIGCILFDNLEELGMKNSVIALVQQDLFLLENQLPFQVLKVLSSLRFKPVQGMFLLVAFANDIKTCGPRTWMGYKFVQDADPLHLLDLLRIKHLGKASGKNISVDIDQNRNENLPNKRHLFHGAKELTAAGIYLRPNTTGYSRDVKFRSYGIWGRLTLPRMIIECSTKQMFLNMIASEASMDNSNEFGFSSYICFLDLLIDHAEDVKELRTAGILTNFLDNDEQVAKLFNEIPDCLVPEVDTHKYVKSQIQKYLNHKRRIKIVSWVVEVIRDHFKSPWTIIAVLVAFIAISLTFVQTYFAIYPPPDKCNETICNYLRNKTL